MLDFCKACGAPVANNCKTCGASKCRKIYFRSRRKNQAIKTKCRWCKTPITIESWGGRRAHQQRGYSYCSQECVHEMLRYHRGNPARDKKLVEMRKNDPHITLGELGDLFGITRERVRQILTKYGVRSASVRKKKPLPPCTVCGKKPRSSYNAKTCGPKCTRELWRQKDTKHSGIKHVTLKCDGCGKTFKRLQRIVGIAQWQGCKRTFCTRKCYHKNKGK